MKIGLIDVDGHNFPNLALMKLSTFHKSKGDKVEFASLDNYDRTYISKVFTFSNEHDIDIANEHFNEVFWSFCPNANLYIENSLPDIPLFYKLKQKCTIGTDSLTSNHQLSILEELKTIQANFPQIPLIEILMWATLNGAEALNLSARIGSFEIGKKPGINLISNINNITIGFCS